MPIAVVETITWRQKTDGKMIPYIGFPSVFIKDKEVKSLTAYSFHYLVENGFGIDSYLFITTRETNGTPYVSYVNRPTIPHFPKYCGCESPLKIVGRHLWCDNKECSVRQNEWVYITTKKLSALFDASLCYPDDVYISIRESSETYFKPREVK